jgi:hypothetical protein
VPLLVKIPAIGEVYLESLFLDPHQPQDLHEDRWRGHPVSEPDATRRIILISFSI